MTFIETTSEAEATGHVAQMFETDRAMAGQVRNLAKALSVAPEIYAAWMALNGSIKARMDLRRYELATVAAARRLRSSYCALEHGSVLLNQFLEAEQLEAIMADHHAAELDEVDVAVMDFADKVAVDASSISESDVERLRALGLTDSEIFDVAAAAAARCFFSKLIDALGVQPDARFNGLPEGVRTALTVGRPIATDDA